MNSLTNKKARLLFFSTLLSAPLITNSAGLTISNQPLFLNESVDPNILVTLDDSGSMAFAYAPDRIEADKNRVYFKSSTYNPLYFNPKVQYKLPKKINVVAGQIQINNYPAPTFTSAWRNGFTQTGLINLATSYRATVEYGRGYDEENGHAQAAYYYEYTPSSNSCSITIESCYTLRRVSDEQKSNFSIWYSFYRTRALATQSAANLAFYNLPENVRVSWQVLNNGNCNIIGQGSSTGYCYGNFLRAFSGQHKTNFFNFLERLSVNGGTPLRTAMYKAGEFLRRSDINGPYADVPGARIGNQYSCRPNYHIMMTDGLWNNDSFNFGNIDNSSFTLPDNTKYSPKSPYADSTYNTLSDLAFYYWATDARADLTNNVPPYIPYKGDNQYFDPRNDPATWQHMVTYTLGLGLTSSLINPRWGGSTYSGDFNKIENGTTSWPAAISNSPNNVYDLWHAAVNSRGEFFSVDSPEAMSEAFSTILSRIADRETSAAAVSLESAVTQINNEAYYARFSSQNWSGQLIKYNINSSTGEMTPTWDARNLLTNSSTRNIYFNKANSLTALTWENLPKHLQDLLNKNDNNETDSEGQNRLSYILGNRSREGTNSNNFRERDYLLGDIIHSSPVVVSKPDSLPYLMDKAAGSNAPGSNNQKYDDFYTEQSERKKRIYVGANDGMLHGFDEDGIERFAYIPTAAFDNLHFLSSQTYQGTRHRYFVDGPIITSDILMDINGQKKWRTILIGSLGAGGRAIFALDVTEPGKERLLWEFNSSNDSDLGYTFGRPIITKLHNGEWGVILSNGYNSENDKGALFVLNAATGSVIKKFTVNTGNLINGLSSPRAADINGDLITDYIYAGDLQGNMWRFDLYDSNKSTFEDIGSEGSISTSSADSWRIAFGGTPLYRARITNSSQQSVVQPITTAPVLVRHPSGTGYIIVFGTGKYIESSDATADTTKSMSLYGIWDAQMDPSKGIANTTPSLSRDNLVTQFITEQGNSNFSEDSSKSNPRDYRVVSRNTVTWMNSQGTAINKYGWYLDLKNGSNLTGEMIATDLTVRANLLLATTTTPNADPCKPDIDRWTLAIDAVTGGATTYNVLDMTKNNIVSNTDRLNGQVVSGIRIPGFGSPTVVGQDAYYNTPDGVQKERLSFGALSQGRQTWRLLENEE